MRGNDYGLAISDITLPTDKPIQSIVETIWGVPALSSHDPERQCFTTTGKLFFGCPSDVAPVAFLKLPTACNEPMKTTASIESVQVPGILQTSTTESVNEEGLPAPLNGCDQPPFTPTITTQPETNAADSPTGLHFDLHSPQDENPETTSHRRV